MNDDISVRKAKHEDMDSLATLSTQLGYPTSANDILKRLLKILSMEDSKVFVAVSPEKRILGWIHVLVSYRLVIAPFAELGGLIVADGCRGQGIGGLLLTKAEGWAKERGLKTFRIRARSSRQRAHHFYTRMGYQLYKEQKIFKKELSNTKVIGPDITMRE
jgi:GNAT superfamily N-acetyltransferase